MKKRTELRIVVMSASLHDTGDFRKYFEDCPHRCLNIPGRSHPVQITVNFEFYFYCVFIFKVQ